MRASCSLCISSKQDAFPYGNTALTHYQIVFLQNRDAPKITVIYTDFINNMKAHKIETVLNEDGILTLQGLPFHAGDAVEVIILKTSIFKQQPASESQIK
ncbi:MAG: hypothetical protein AAF630_12055, partial [Cyanobacteria bacterium P01_C01_bin.38]